MVIDHKFSAMSALKQEKAQPFGAHFSTRLAGVNNKLTCALSNVPPPDAPEGGCNGANSNGDDVPSAHVPITDWPL